MSSPLVARLQEFGTTVFAQMSALAVEHDAVNLGQGFPDEDGPQEVLRAAIRAVEGGRNQYPPLLGAPDLRAAIAEHQESWYGLRVDPATEVLVTAGATEALALSVLALCEPGDEVVLIEPVYDCYPVAVALAGATRRTVALDPVDLSLDLDALRTAVGPRTRAIVVNTPHNPTGKVFTREELAGIARIALDAGCWVLTDEVYEHLTYDVAHVPLAQVIAEDPALAGLRDRVLTISSAGKTFSVTGWKVGWITGPAAAIAAVATVKQYFSFTGGAPFQPAVATGLRLPRSTYAAFSDSLRRRRDLLADGLAHLGFAVRPAQGTYFLVADAAPLGVSDGLDFCLRLPAEAGVAAIPLASFCTDPAPVRSLVRFAYCKREDVLREALARLQRRGAGAR